MDLNKHLKRAESLSHLLDNKYKVFGLAFGLDPLLDIIPGIGSVVGGVASVYIFWIAIKLQVPFLVYFKMGLNILLDTFLGEIPLVGILFDAYFKSNNKNLKMLKKYIVSNVLETEINK